MAEFYCSAITPSPLRLSGRRQFQNITAHACFAVFVFAIFCRMDASARAIETLRKTEQALRGLVAEAAAAGDYASVVRIAEWAKAVSGLCMPESTIRKTNVATVAPKRKVARRDQPKDNDYPRFYRHEDAVVRIALSKRRGEYQHKAPYAVLVALADAMVESGQDGRIFSTDDFLPLKVGAEEVPQYQAYLGIALFKHSRLIDQHGRQGYSIPRLAEFKNAVTAIWKKLPRNTEKRA